MSRRIASWISPTPQPPKHVTKRLKQHWLNTRIVWRGDSHYGRVEAMDWAQDNETDYIFGLAGKAVLDALVAEIADDLRFHHAISRKAKQRTFASFMYTSTTTTYRHASIFRMPRWNQICDDFGIL
jgi:Transposase DDE domain group 1